MTVVQKDKHRKDHKTQIWILNNNRLEAYLAVALPLIKRTATKEIGLGFMLS